MSRSVDTTPGAATVGRWTVDPATSTATFAVGNLGRTVEGIVPIRSGTVTFGADGVLESVRGEVDLGALDTGNPRRDRDLRRPGLLDLDAQPRATFTADEITSAESGWTVAGTLSARGRGTRVEFHAERDRAAEDLVLVAEATFDRRALGIRAPRLMIGRSITVTLRARLLPDSAQR